MASGPSLIQSPSGNNNESSYPFRRSGSRVFYESEYSSPTSWEYRAPNMPLELSSPIAQVPDRVHNSPYVILSPTITDNSNTSSHIIVNNSTTNNNNNSCIDNSNHGDGSRSSSSGSSSSSNHSQRSHDSGFSDSGENGKKSAMNKSLHRSRKKEDTCSSLSPHNNTSTLYHEMIVAQQQQSFHNYESPHGLSVKVSPDYCTSMSPSCQSVCNFPNGSGHLGYPVCSSTPKRELHDLRPVSRISASRLVSMQKIDNFQTLNKNEKSLDSNNNSTGSANSSKQSTTSSSGCYPSLMNRTVVISKSSKSGNNNSSGLTKKKSDASFHSQSVVSSISRQCSSSGNNNSNSGGTYNLPSSSATFTRSPAPSFSHSSHGDHQETVISTGKKSISFAPSVFSYEEDDDRRNNNNVAVGASGCSTTTTRKEESLLYSSHQQCSDVWDDLPLGFKRVPATSVNASRADKDNMVIVKSHVDNEAMRLWLHEMRTLAEPECWHMLQTKDIPRSLESHVVENETGSSISDVSGPLLSIRNVEQMANLISAQFPKICKCIEFSLLPQVPPLVFKLTNLIDNFLQETAGRSGAYVSHLVKLERRLSSICHEVCLSASNMVSVLNGLPEKNLSHDSAHYSVIQEEPENPSCQMAVTNLVDGIVRLGNCFSEVVDCRLTRDLSTLLESIEGNGLHAKVALRCFLNLLTDGGVHMCRLASKIRTVRGLLRVLLDHGKDNEEKMLALRCLATMLNMANAVKDFDRAGGFEIIADYLYESSVPLLTRVEAIAVFTQATDPWIDLETALGNLSMHLEKIVVALTNLISPCKWEEDHFLLLVAAISNLTFLEVASIRMLSHYKTVSMLIEVAQRNPNFSVFVNDHIATILANMSAVEYCRPEIVQANGIIVLLKYLHKRPSLHIDSAAEISACERLQQKSTIALSRLSSERGVAQLAYNMGGIHRLAQLCRRDQERNYSDGVLIAALATLRKLVDLCGDEITKELHADDLIKPRLLDSFLMYSSRQESYV